MATEGHMPLAVAGIEKPCQTWYKTFGPTTTTNSLVRRPLILLHGGPGVPSAYLTPLAESLWSEHSISVILYDQVGCGKSTHLPDKNGDTAFWTSDLFIHELESLVKHLGLTDYDVMGGSWGGMLAFDYAYKKPKGLKHLILHSTPAAMYLFEDANKKLLKQMPEEIQKTIEKHEEEGSYEDPEYEKAVMEFQKKFFCRVDPFPKELTEAMEEMGKDPTVYMTMLGPSEFNVQGPLKKWTAIPRLFQIKVPTLLINGRYDQVQDDVIDAFFYGLDRVRWVTLDKSAHMAFEEMDRLAEVVASFLKPDGSRGLHDLDLHRKRMRDRIRKGY